MTNKILLKGLLGATALTVFTAGNAHAQFTPAGTDVENTFTLTYDVGGVAQPPIDTSLPGDPNGPTLFTVDRLIDLTVASLGDNTVAPGATDEELVFSVTNEGNDTQAYLLTLFEETGDDIDTDDPVGAEIVYYIDDGDGVFDPVADGPAIVYDPTATGFLPPELGQDEVLFVVVTQDIPAAAVDGNRADLTLVADTLEPQTSLNAGTPVTADTDGNDIIGDAENVLADDTGTARELANEGDHSATGTYIVAAADVEALKTVTIHREDGLDCGIIPGLATGGYAIPGACVEYVITVENSGSSAATDIVINDVLRDQLDFAGAVFGGDFTGGAFTSPALPGAGTDCTGGACVINLTGATLPAPADPTIPTIGTVTIRANVK